MNLEVRLVAQARLDLVEQATYLAENASFEVSDRFLDAAKSTFAKLADLPTIGRPWEGLYPSTASGIRVWRVEGFPKILIFFRPKGSSLTILRLLHSARDLPPLVDGLF